MSNEDPTGVIYYNYPSTGIVPHSNDHDGCLWIEIQAQRLISQTVNANGEPNVSSKMEMFRFLAPDSIIEHLGHTWAGYESLYSRASQAGATAIKGINEGAIIGNAGVSLIKAITNTSSIKQKLASMATAAGKTNVTQTRIDTPLSYQDSDRRKYDFEFQLVDEGDTYNNVVFPVKKLEQYSCPGFRNGVTIDLPYVFKIRSFPNHGGKSLIDIGYSALTVVTGTYNGPYRNGFPTHATLSLSFEELQPLYRESFDEIEMITTGESGIAVNLQLNKLDKLTSQKNQALSIKKPPLSDLDKVKSQALSIKKPPLSDLDKVKSQALAIKKQAVDIQNKVMTSLSKAESIKGQTLSVPRKVANIKSQAKSISRRAAAILNNKR